MAHGNSSGVSVGGTGIGIVGGKFYGLSEMEVWKRVGIDPRKIANYSYLLPYKTVPFIDRAKPQKQEQKKEKTSKKSRRQVRIPSLHPPVQLSSKLRWMKTFRYYPPTSIADQISESDDSDSEEMKKEDSPFDAKGYYRIDNIPSSSHYLRRGYTTKSWHKEYRMREVSPTTLKPKRFVSCAESCGSECWRDAWSMMQFVLLKVSDDCLDDGPVDVYGFLAVRDPVEPLRNYLFNRTRDDPIRVEKGSSVLTMTGPSRGIVLLGSLLVEYDLKIKSVESEKDDKQLIDGCFEYHEHPIEYDVVQFDRIDGKYGGVLLEYAFLDEAVEATVEVEMFELSAKELDMKISALTCGLTKESVLFDSDYVGTVTDTGKIADYFIVAATIDRKLELILKFRQHAAGTWDERRLYFVAHMHGDSFTNILTEFGVIAVKISWSAVSMY